MNKLVQNGIDQCQVAMKKLQRRSRIKQMKHRTSPRQFRAQFSRTAQEARELLFDRISSQTEDVMRKAREVLLAIYNQEDFRANGMDEVSLSASSTAGTKAESIEMESQTDSEMEDDVPLRDLAEHPSVLDGDARVLPEFDHHQHAVRKRRPTQHSSWVDNRKRRRKSRRDKRHTNATILRTPAFSRRVEHQFKSQPRNESALDGASTGKRRVRRHEQQSATKAQQRRRQQRKQRRQIVCELNENAQRGDDELVNRGNKKITQSRFDDHPMSADESYLPEVENGEQVRTSSFDPPRAQTTVPSLESLFRGNESTGLDIPHRPNRQPRKEAETPTAAERMQAFLHANSISLENGGRLLETGNNPAGLSSELSGSSQHGRSQERFEEHNQQDRLSVHSDPYKSALPHRHGPDMDNENRSDSFERYGWEDQDDMGLGGFNDSSIHQTAGNGRPCNTLNLSIGPRDLRSSCQHIEDSFERFNVTNANRSTSALMNMLLSQQLSDRQFRPVSERRNAFLCLFEVYSNHANMTLLEVIHIRPAMVRAHIKLICCMLMLFESGLNLPPPGGEAATCENTRLAFCAFCCGKDGQKGQVGTKSWFYNSLILQLIEVLYAVFMPEAWDVRFPRALLRVLVPLRDALRPSTEDVADGILNRLPPQQWRQRDGTWFVSSLDPESFRAFLNTGCRLSDNAMPQGTCQIIPVAVCPGQAQGIEKRDDCTLHLMFLPLTTEYTRNPFDALSANIAADTRFDLYKSNPPRNEIDCVFAMLTFLTGGLDGASVATGRRSVPSVLLREDGVSGQKWRLLSTLLFSAAGVLSNRLSGLSDLQGDAPAQQHIEKYRSEMDTVRTLISIGAMDPLPSGDGFLKKLLVRGILLCAQVVAAASPDRPLLIRNARKDRSKVRHLWVRALSSSRVGTDREVDGLAIEAMDGLYTESHMGLSGCIEVAGAWMSRVQKRKARLSRLVGSLSTVKSLFASKAQQLSPGNEPGKSGSSDQSPSNSDTQFAATDTFASAFGHVRCTKPNETFTKGFLMEASAQILMLELKGRTKESNGGLGIVTNLEKVSVVVVVLVTLSRSIRRLTLSWYCWNALTH